MTTELLRCGPSMDCRLKGGEKARKINLNSLLPLGVLALLCLDLWESAALGWLLPGHGASTSSDLAAAYTFRRAHQPLRLATDLFLGFPAAKD